MKVYYLGSCSGTEPMVGMHHCSLIMEIGGVLYWFDAGENCAHTAYTSGIDMMNTKCLFVSHPHVDHIGGLASLLACMYKIIRRYGLSMKHDGALHVYMPAEGYLDAANLIAGECNKGKKKAFDLIEHKISDGVIFEDGNVKITALHNKHLRETGESGWHSYSFLVEGEGRRTVFSGDVLTPDELDPLIADGCDLLIMETGHHSVADVCEFARSRGVRTLRFNHHGREIIENRAAAQAYIDDFAKTHGIDIKLCYDTMVDSF